MYFWKYNKKYTWKQISYPVIQMYVRVDILVIYYIFFNFFLFCLYCPIFIQWKNYYVNQLYTVIFHWLYCSLWASWLTIKHLFVCKKHFHDNIISLRESVWAHKSSLTLPLYWSVCTNLGRWEVIYMCISCIDFVSVSTVFLTMT